MEDAEVMKKLEDIEGAAQRVLKTTTDRKSEISKEFQEKTEKFDREQDEASRKKIEEIRSRQETLVKTKLDALNQQMEDSLKRMQTEFADKEDEQAEKIVSSLLA